jgi:trigger factor
MASETHTHATNVTELHVEVSEPSNVTRKLSITVPAERVGKIRRQVAAQISRNVKVPGFRKGKIPESMMRKQFGQAIEQETVDRVIQETYKEALDQGNHQPIAQGEIQNVHYHGDGGELHYDVQFEVHPKMELTNVSGFVVARPADQVGEAEVDAVLERIRQERATLTGVEGTKPDYNDVVSVEITPLDVEDGEPQPYEFALGEGQAIPAMEEAIMSLLPGEENDFDVAFPEDFPDPEQAGKTQRMRIRLDDIKRRELPAMDDEFAKTLGDFETVAALRERVLADLQADSSRRSEAAVRDALVGQIVEANPVDVPESMVGRYVDYMMGIDPDRERKSPQERSPEQQERISQLRELMRPQAEAALRRMLVVEHLADREGLRATQDEIDERVEKLAEAQGRTPADVWLELEKGGQLQGLEIEITEDKVFEWLRSHNTVG